MSREHPNEDFSDGWHDGFESRDAEIGELRAEIERLKAENAELRAMIDEGLPTADDVRGIMRG